MNTGTQKVYRTVALARGISDSHTFVMYAIKVFISMLRMDTAIAPSPGSLKAKCYSELNQSKPTGCLVIIGINIWLLRVK